MQPSLKQHAHLDLKMFSMERSQRVPLMVNKIAVA